MTKATRTSATQRDALELTARLQTPLVRAEAINRDLRRDRRLRLIGRGSVVILFITMGVGFGYMLALAAAS